MLCAVAAAQEFPVEIELVPPSPDSGVTFSVLSAPTVISEPEWKPPARPCRVCGGTKVNDACSCDEPLTQTMADGLLRKVGAAVAAGSCQKIVLAKPVTIRAVSSGRLRQLGGERLLGLYEDGVIWVSYELNRRQATAVIAHEYGHAWFFQHRSDVNAPTELLFEGFAEWVCYLALRELGDTDGAAKIEYADQSIYGRGARKLMWRHRREGMDAVLQLVLVGRNL